MQEMLADIEKPETNETPETQETQKAPETKEQGAPEVPEAGEAEDPENSEEGESKPEGSEESETKPETKPETRSNKRIRELNEAKKQAESKAAELENRLRQIEARQAEIDKLAVGEMPDPSKFETMNDYINALTDAKLTAATKKMEQDRLTAERVNAEQALVSEIVSTFEQRVQIAAQSNPDLPKAVEHLNSMAQFIPVEVRHALLTDENAAQLAWEIATNQDLLDYMCKQNPTNSIKLIGKLSTQFDVDEAPAQVAQKAPTAFAPTAKPNAPVAFSPAAKQAPKVPSVPKSGTNANSTDGLTGKKYWDALRSGKVTKKPWED